MERNELRNFPEWFKIIIDRICQAESLTRQELADALDVHVQSVSTAGYRGQIGYDLLDRLARRAKVSAQEMAAIELAWLEMRSQRVQGGPLTRSVDIIEALMAQILAMEAWIDEMGLQEKYRQARVGDGLAKRSRRLMRKKT